LSGAGEGCSNLGPPNRLGGAVGGGAPGKVPASGDPTTSRNSTVPWLADTLCPLTGFEHPARPATSNNTPSHRIPFTRVAS
jgi:hypothetical protein